MGAAKKNAANKQSPSLRAKKIPVRVLPVNRPVRREAPGAAAVPVAQRRAAQTERKAAPKDADRRRLMWVGVTVVAAVIFVLWIGYMRQTLTTAQGDKQTFFGKIANEISSVFKKFGKYKPPVNSQEQELNDLRNRVFPAIDTNGNGYEFSTTHPANTNGAPDEDADLNANVNTPLTTNTDTP